MGLCTHFGLHHPADRIILSCTTAGDSAVYDKSLVGGDRRVFIHYTACISLFCHMRRIESACNMGETKNGDCGGRHSRSTDRTRILAFPFRPEIHPLGAGPFHHLAHGASFRVPGLFHLFLVGGGLRSGDYLFDKSTMEQT